MLLYSISIIIIALMAIESALILIIIINFYKLKGSLSLKSANLLRG